MSNRNKFKCIYVLIGPNQSAYVGQTIDPINRKSRYKTLTCRNQTNVYASLLEHGYENHTFNIIHVLSNDASREELDFYESFYFYMYFHMGFKMMNLKSPGWNGVPNQEARERLRKSHIGQIAWNKGKKGVQKAWNKGIKRADYANR